MGICLRLAAWVSGLFFPQSHKQAATGPLRVPGNLRPTNKSCHATTVTIGGKKKERKKEVMGCGRCFEESRRMKSGAVPWGL